MFEAETIAGRNLTVMFINAFLQLSISLPFCLNMVGTELLKSFWNICVYKGTNKNAYKHSFLVPLI